MSNQDEPPDSISFRELNFRIPTPRVLNQAALKQQVQMEGAMASDLSEQRKRLQAEILNNVDWLITRAREYLDYFVKKELFERDGEWGFDEILLDISHPCSPDYSPDYFGLSFVHCGDVYGHWIVIFYLLDERQRELQKVIAVPVAYSREQR